MSKLPPQYHSKVILCAVGALVSCLGVKVAAQWDLVVLLVISCAIGLLALLGVTATTVFYTRQYLSKFTRD